MELFEHIYKLNLKLTKPISLIPSLKKFEKRNKTVVENPQCGSIGKLSGLVSSKKVSVERQKEVGGTSLA